MDFVKAKGRRRRRPKKIRLPKEDVFGDDELNAPVQPKKPRNYTALELRQIAGEYFKAKNYAVHFEVGLVAGGKLRADVLAVNLKGEIMLMEVKSSVADFKSDKKWHLYKEYCDKMWFVFTDSTYQKVKHLVPKGIGIMVVNDHYSYITSKQRATKNEVDQATRMGVITRMAYRSAPLNSHKHKNRFVYSSANQVVLAVTKALKQEFHIPKATLDELVNVVKSAMSEE